MTHTLRAMDKRTATQHEPRVAVWAFWGYMARYADAVPNTYCWGDNSLGQLGNGTTASSTTGVTVSARLQLASLRGRGGSTCGAASSQTAYFLDENKLRQLGHRWGRRRLRDRRAASRDQTSNIARRDGGPPYRGPKWTAAAGLHRRMQAHAAEVV